MAPPVHYIRSMSSPTEIATERLIDVHGGYRGEGLVNLAKRGGNWISNHSTGVIVGSMFIDPAIQLGQWAFSKKPPPECKVLGQDMPDRGRGPGHPGLVHAGRRPLSLRDPRRAV